MQVDGNERLDRSVVPQRYELDLEIDPARDRFSGRVTIEVRIEKRTDVVRLHGQDLEIGEVAVESAQGRHEVRLALGANGGLALQVSPPLERGAARLHFEYEAPLPETPFGVYRVPVGADWYVFTQFQPLDGRRAFPCFDQPEFKTPYTVTLRTPPDSIAVANAPETRRSEEGGLAVHHFAQTRPLPSYLVAFAVGPFDVVELPASASPTPMRVLAPRGRGSLSDFALDWSPRILAWLSDYFDRPYPFAKLDLIAVPNFRAGAMENAGLVTFRERLLLVAENAPTRQRITSLLVIAHEFAHMWFGDLVTLAWWDDLWLNESFASWMASKTIDDLVPEFELRLRAVAHRQYVMDLDSKQGARPIRRPIRHGGDVYNAFDGITYGKGEAVLQMVENWIGADAFRDSVRRYLSTHAYRSATTEDLLEAISATSGREVGGVIGSFLDQPGTPLLDVTLLCEEGAEPRVELLQSRYFPGRIALAPGGPWQIPICLVWGAEPNPSIRVRDCFVEGERMSTHQLVGDRCPTWLHPNADEIGYYRWQLSEDRLLALLRDSAKLLSPAEQVAIPGLLSAQLEAGHLSLAGYLEGLRSLSASGNWRVVEGVAYGLARLRRTAAAASLAEPYAAFTRSLLGWQLDQVGLKPRPDEPIADRLLRGPLLDVLADAGRDPAVRLLSVSAAETFVADPDSLPGDVAAVAVRVAARTGDAGLWRALVSLVSLDLDPWQRVVVVGALGSFEDPKLVASSLDLVLDGTLRSQDYVSLVRAVRPSARGAAWSWLVRRYDELVEVLGEKSAPGLPSMGSGFCKREDAQRVNDFFSETAHAPEGTEHNLRLVVEGIERCVALREAATEPLRAYLAKPF